jgi:photosystem II stability/assembly factor-like uncharacterized protein
MIHWFKIFLLYVSFISVVLILHISQYSKLAIPSSVSAAQPATQTDIPKITAIYKLGVPIGNATIPRYLALNSQMGQLYLFSEGGSEPKQGNSLTIYDIKSGEFIKQLNVNQGDNEPLDLEFEPISGLIYALWRGRSGETLPVLTVIDSRSLQIAQELPDVKAIAAGNGRLYTARDEQITVFEGLNNALVEINQIQLAPAVAGPLAVSPAANRLYFARDNNGIWQVDIFDTETLRQVGSYPTESPVLKMLPLSAGNEVFVIVAQIDFQTLYRLTSEGELADLPYELGPRFGAAGIALSPDGQTIYFSNGQVQPASPSPAEAEGPALIGLAEKGLAPLHTIPLPANVEDLVIDLETKQAFGIYPYEHHLYVVDLERETVEIINTAISLKDVFIDEKNQRIYISDTANRVRQFESQSLKLLHETKLTENLSDYGFRSASWAGELALDQERNQLYVSGLPATVLEADTLTPITTLTPGGQLEPDPGSDKIYASYCGVTILNADTLSGDTVIPDTGQRPDGLAPNPCVSYSQLDPVHQLLYSIVPNGVPGSNSGSYLYVYDLTAEPSLIFTDTNISLVSAEPDSAGQRAFVNYIRFSNRRLLTLDMTTKPGRYVDQLIGLWGETRYSPTTNRLYVNDREFPRLLTLAADTLDVIGETDLPTDDYYQLKALDTLNERLYLVGSRGQLLVISGNPADAEMVETPTSARPARTPDGAVLTIASRGTDTLARIEASYDEYSYEPRLYTSPNQGQSWSDLSQTLPALPIQGLAVSPAYQTDQTLFAGLVGFGRTGGLYKSIDGGQSWLEAMAGLQDLWVNALFISPDFTQTGLIFAQTTYAGLHQSTDSGQSWTPVVPLDPNSPFPAANQPGTVAFSDNGLVLISQTIEETSGIFRAAAGPDGALSGWQQLFDLPVERLGLSPDGQAALGFANGLWRSGDGGLTWEAGGAGLTGIENLKAYHILFSPAFAQDQTIYFFFNDPAGDLPGQLFRSTDGGQNWQPWVEPDSGKIFTSITWASEGEFLLGDSTAQLTRLAPASLSWRAPETPTASFAIDDLAVSPNYQADQTLFALSSQYGLYKSSNGGQDWRLTGFPARGHGFSLKKAQLAISPAYAQDETLYVATGRSLHRSEDGGDSWEQLHLADHNKPGPEFSFQAQQIALSPDFGDNRTLLVSIPTAIYRSTDEGDTWQEVLNPADETTMTDILTFGPDGQRAYARFGYSYSLFASDDGGQSWQQLPSNKDELFAVISTAVAPDGALTVALEFDRRLLQTGPQIQPWQEISQTIPETLTGITAVTYGPNDALFIGGPGGIFQSADNGQNWQALPGNGLPLDVVLTDLDSVNSQLFATTAAGEIFTSADSGASWLNVSVIK